MALQGPESACGGGRSGMRMAATFGKHGEMWRMQGAKSAAVTAGRGSVGLLSNSWWPGSPGFHLTAENRH